MKHNYLFSLTFAVLMAACLCSCEKKEQPIKLPPKGPALQGSVTMGENYESQVFYDFESNSVVKTSEVASWDLALESSKEGYHVWMNGGKGLFIANSHEQTFTAFKQLPAGLTNTSFLFDDPSGIADSTAVGDWRKTPTTSKGEVYIVKYNDTTYYKFRMLSVSDTAYAMEWSDIKSTDPQTVVLKKDPAYNRVFFSFSGGIVTPEPEKTAWDVAFTRYRYIYRDLDNLPYYVNGVLLNPYNTSAIADSVHAFSAIDATTVAGSSFTNRQDAIGFDWKIYNFTTARYEINPRKNFILSTRNGQVIKLHFLDFYSPTGVKGSPSFESLRIE